MATWQFAGGEIFWHYMRTMQNVSSGQNNDVFLQNNQRCNYFSPLFFSACVHCTFFLALQMKRSSLKLFPPHYKTSVCESSKHCWTGKCVCVRVCDFSLGSLHSGLLMQSSIVLPSRRKLKEKIRRSVSARAGERRGFLGHGTRK